MEENSQEVIVAHSLHLLPDANFGDETAANLQCGRCGKTYGNPTLASREVCVPNDHWSNHKEKA